MTGTAVAPPPAAPTRAAGAVRRRRHWWPFAALALVNLLVLAGPLSPVRGTLLLPLLILLPGHLTLRLARVRRPSGVHTLLLTVASGLLWLLAVSLVLGLLGALRPAWCLLGFDVVVAGLAAAVLRRGGPPAETGLARPGPVTWPAAAAMVAAGAAVAFAVTGARHLNGGGSAVLTVLALVAGALSLLLVAAAAARKDPDGRSLLPAAAVVVYLLGLAVLLATSLRGAGVTGHDIKLEFRVFQDTLAAGTWRPGTVLADYNSCLSITTLPTLLHHLLGVAPLDVFRVCYQVIFAAVPVGVLLIARTLLPTAIAALAAGLYVAFPTFVNDMPMLNRQELALLFFTLAVLTLLDRDGSPRQRTALFAALVAGLTVSHYGSTYVTGGVLLTGWLLLRLRDRAGRRRAATGGRGARLLDRTDRHLAVTGLRPAALAGPHLLAWPAVVTVLLAAVAWSFAAGSGAGLVTTVRTTATSVFSGGGTESDAVRYSFLRPAPAVSDAQALREFTAANGARPGPAEQAAACPVVLRPEATLPRTGAGDVLAAAGAAPEQVNRWSRRLAVVLYELGAVAGVLLLWVAGRRTAGPARALAALGGGALVVLAATVVLPQLSVDYGLLRMFQQSLVILAPAVVLAPAAAAGRRAATAATAVVVTGCLLTTSGLGPQLIGGYPPQLNLNNSGAYFRAYHVSADDLAAARWLAANLPPGALLSADSAAFRTLRATTGLYPLEGVAPAMVPARAYLQVTQVGPDSAEAVAIARDRILTYTFRLSCVTGGRPLLHAAGTHRVYGPAS